MANETKPKAPNVKEQFNQAANAAPKPQEKQETKPDIATKAELEARVAQRQKPAIKYERTFRGEIKTAVDTTEQAKNEARIKRLESRLQQKQLRREFNRNAKQGRKVD